MKHLQWLLATACMLAVCLSVSAQSGKKVKSISPEKWVKSKVWSEGLKAKPHSSTNLAEFKAQYEANPEQWKAAFRWLASHDLTTIEKGKHPIEGTSLVDHFSIKNTVCQEIRRIDFTANIANLRRFYKHFYITQTRECTARQAA